MEFLPGGAMKPTTDGRWAHLACAMWIPGLFVYDFIYSFLVLSWLCLLSVKFLPETCLADVKRMEPIDGLSRISKVVSISNYSLYFLLFSFYVSMFFGYDHFHYYYYYYFLPKCLCQWFCHEF